MRSVLQPLNEKAADTIVNHLNLLDSATLNPLLLQLVAHVTANRVILKLWDEGSIDQWSAVSYPDKLPEYIEREFKKIKRKQAELLGMKAAPRNGSGEEEQIPASVAAQHVAVGKTPPRAKL